MSNPGSGIFDWTGEGTGGAGQPSQPPSAPEVGVLPTETLFLNGALAMIGASKIAGIDDGSVGANHCKVLYPPLLDALLRMNHWNFAGARAVLQVSTTKPAFQYTYAYPLPSDWLKTREFNGGTVSISTEGLVFFDGVWLRRYEIEGRSMVTNDSPAYLVYTRRVTDPSQWDALFYQLALHWLASYLANAIPKDTRKAASLMQTAMGIFMPISTGTDGQERSIHPISVDDLTRGR